MWLTWKSLENVIQHDRLWQWWSGEEYSWRVSLAAVRYRHEILRVIVRPYAGAVSPGFLLVHDNARVYSQLLNDEGIDAIDWPSHFQTWIQLRTSGTLCIGYRLSSAHWFPDTGLEGDPPGLSVNYTMCMSKDLQPAYFIYRDPMCDWRVPLIFFRAYIYIYIYVWPWTTKPVLSRWGIFVAIAKNTLYGSKLSIFSNAKNHYDIK